MPPPALLALTAIWLAFVLAVATGWSAVEPGLRPAYALAALGWLLLLLRAGTLAAVGEPLGVGLVAGSGLAFLGSLYALFVHYRRSGEFAVE